MKCPYSEETLALYVGGDTQLDESREIGAHLSTCSACRAVAETLRKAQLLVKSLRGDSLNTSALLQLRENVLMGMTHTERASGWRRSIERSLFTRFSVRYAFGGATAVAVLLAFSLSLLREAPQPTRTSPNAALTVTPGPAIVDAVAPDTPPQPVARHRVRRRVAKTAPAQPPVMVKLFTDDPDVVIYWFLDGKEEME